MSTTDAQDARRVALAILGEINTPQPVRFGVPIPQGTLAGSQLQGQLVSTDSTRSAQTHALRNWPDGSVKWVLVDSVLWPGDENLDWHVGISPVFDAYEEGSVGAAGARLRFDSPWSVLGGDCWTLRDEAGKEIRFHESEFTESVTDGPVCQSIVQRLGSNDAPHLDLELHWRAYPSIGLTGCEATLRNKRRAKHVGNCWDLGDPGSQMIREFAFRLDLPVPSSNVESPGRLLLKGESPLPFRSECRVQQHASGGRNWNGRNHLNADGVVDLVREGFTASADQLCVDGERAAPLVSWEAEGGTLSVGLAEFWQRFPNAIRVQNQSLAIDLFPREGGIVHELQGGEQMTKQFWLQWQPADATRHGDVEAFPTLDWIDSPARVKLSSSDVESARVTPPFAPSPSKSYDHFRQLMDEALDGPESIVSLRERQDEFGWRNFGETVANHEEIFYEGSEEFVSHYNNQFDVLLGFLRQYLRTGSRRWFDLADSLAKHVIDIDIYHTFEDRSVYNNGLFWFTDHYLTAHTCTHRTFSRHNQKDGRPYGGGPGPEHNYAEGMLLYYELTGSEAARKSVVGLADWVIAMEDATLTPFGWVDDLPTGKATLGFTKPSRGGANSISVLIDGWRLTGSEHYREFAETLMRRCIHPHDDIDALDLLNVEKNWSYTMFLSSVDKYLSAMDEFGKDDGLYDYARAALVHYAKWMLHHERSYFDQRETLEFPTEAWPAQELRKGNVMRKASRFCDPDLAGSLQHRANEFSDRAWEDLMSFTETRTTIRSLALIMNEGLTDCVLRSHPPSPGQGNRLPNEFPPRESFTPQKDRIKQMLRSPKGLLQIASRSCSPVRWTKWRRARNQGGGIRV